MNYHEDEYSKHQKHLKESTEEMSEKEIELYDPENYGFTHRDRSNGNLYCECTSCGMIMEQEDNHSGGECNMCHAMNKDD